MRFRHDVQSSVEIAHEPPFPEPAEERRKLPRYNTSPQCSRGLHDWPIETLCRGYEALGCGGVGSHVHRRCLTHAVETVEAMPMRLVRE